MSALVDERGTTETTEQRSSRAWLVLVIALAVAVFCADQLTKALVTQQFALATNPPVLQVLGDYVRFVYVTNTGAAFGMLPQATVFLAIVAIIAIPALFYFQRYLVTNGWIAHVAVGLMLGGDVGNLWDRLSLGHVIDFIDVGIGTTRWYVFNIADATMVIGVLLLAGYILFFSDLSKKGNAN